ncbi:phytohormone-binding protein-like protein [Tanacetum coccineum]
MKEDTAQLKVAIPIKVLWKAMSIDIRHITPKILPNIVSEVELLEGDGGYGSILLFKFCPDVPKVTFQREKIVEFDESVHYIAFEILEGGHLDHGFLKYTTAIKLTEVGEAETLIDMKALYETKPEHNHVPGDTLKATLLYLRSFETYLLKTLP